ncbi:MAG: lysophospholipid acyltransferase family protein [Gemmatimonadales bacterium]|nr:lysophospholipid acyltransferase family protein [Gemmatimonadales bacterium]
MAASAPLRLTMASLWTWGLLALFAVLFLPLVLLWRVIGWPVDRWNYYGGRLFRHIGWLVVRGTARWKFEVRGTPPTNPRHPYVVVANHESFADIIALTLLPWEMKWLSKASIFRIPVFGWHMWAARDIAVHRGKAASAKAAMEESRKRLDGKVSVMIFPEGTRSSSAEMLPFKDGAFRLAIEAGVPLLPMAIYGTREAIAKNDWRIGRSHAILEILAPEPTDGLALADLPELKERVRQRIGEARDRLREELRQDGVRGGN